MDKILEVRNTVLNKLAHKLEGFYLAGGTALTLFYFQHRESFDLDFFSKEFARARIDEIMSGLSEATQLTSQLSAEQNKKGFARLAVFSLIINSSSALKIDFVEDLTPLLKPLKEIDGIPVLSLEDIYLRKILTACGSIATVDEFGRSSFIGGRQEAKDLFDLYFLSTTFMPLSAFLREFCRQAFMESVVIWFRTFDRLRMKTGLLDIMTNKTISYQDIEAHFKAEVGKLISAEL
jgi:predicted nucleotidyltransferase component of viral defense system